MQSAFSKVCARLEKISGAMPYWREDFRGGLKRKISALREIAEAAGFDLTCRRLAFDALREIRHQKPGAVAPKQIREARSSVEQGEDLERLINQMLREAEVQPEAKRWFNRLVLDQLHNEGRRA